MHVSVLHNVFTNLIIVWSCSTLLWNEYLNSNLQTMQRCIDWGHNTSLSSVMDASHQHATYSQPSFVDMDYLSPSYHKNKHQVTIHYSSPSENINYSLSLLSISHQWLQWGKTQQFCFARKFSQCKAFDPYARIFISANNVKIQGINIQQASVFTRKF